MTLPISIGWSAFRHRACNRPEDYSSDSPQSTAESGLLIWVWSITTAPGMDVADVCAAITQWRSLSAIVQVVG